VGARFVHLLLLVGGGAVTRAEEKGFIRGVWTSFTGFPTISKISESLFLSFK